MRRINKKGFTLIEMLAAVLIVGVLSGTAIAGVTSTSNNSHKDYCRNNGDMLVIAGRDYFNDNKTKLPDEIGEEECVNLQTLLNEKYIDEEMVDYEGTKCDNSTSRVCVIRKTKDDFHYRRELNCGKCNEIDEQASRKDSTMTITYTPNGGNSNNKDINVVVKLANTGADIISYKYTIYKREGSSAVKVGGIEYKEYKKKDINIKLEEEGTFYIETTAINEYGDKKTEVSKDYVLTYSLEAGCGSQISIYARSKNSTKIGASSNLGEAVWYNGDFTFYVDKKGAIKSFDVYVKRSEESKYTRLITRSTGNKTLTYNRDRVLDNKQYQTSNISSEPKGYIGRTDTYSIYVVGYDEKGESCETRKYNFYQDNTDPTCETVSTTSEAGYHFGAGASYPQSKWVNQNILLTGVCRDTLREPGRVNSVCKSNITNGINVGWGSFYNNTPTAGTVYDIAGNSIVCPYENVRIDKIPPRCGRPPVGGGYGYIAESGASLNKTVSGVSPTHKWYTGNISLFPVPEVDNESGHWVASVNGQASLTLTENKKGITVTYLTYDIAGNTCTYTDNFYKDSTAPKCTSDYTAPSNYPNGYDNGWTNQNVTVRGNCSDSVSGCPTKTIKKTLSSEMNKSVSPGTVYNEAGLSTTCPSKTVKIDKTKPTCTSHSIRCNGAQAAIANVDCSDAGGSGLVYAYHSYGNSCSQYAGGITYGHSSRAPTGYPGFPATSSRREGESCYYSCSNCPWCNGWYACQTPASDCSITDRSGTTVYIIPYCSHMSDIRDAAGNVANGNRLAGTIECR